MSLAKAFELAKSFYAIYDGVSPFGDTLTERCVGYVHDAMHMYYGAGISDEEEAEVVLFQYACFMEKEAWWEKGGHIRAFLQEDFDYEFLWKFAQTSPDWVKDLNRKYPIDLLTN
jgi:hypothetical protein